MSDCRYYEDGKCEKYSRKYSEPVKCAPCKLEYFSESFTVLDTFEEACEKSSIFGNSAVYITEKNIEDLRKGKILMHNDGEYCTFVILKKESEVMQK